MFELLECKTVLSVVTTDNYITSVVTTDGDMDGTDGNKDEKNFILYIIDNYSVAFAILSAYSC